MLWKACVSIVILILGVVRYPILSKSSPRDSDTLRVLIIYFRHGARAPSRPYTSDPHKDYVWLDGWGSLTKKGMFQLYKLGNKFRNHYANFIPEEYHEKDVYVRSSDRTRCLMSAYTFLAGLFPPSDKQTWHSNINWQPIPVHSLPREIDDIVAGTKYCQVYKDMYFELLNETSTNFNLSDTLLHYVGQRMNETVKDMYDLSILYNTLLAQEAQGLAIPEWATSVFSEKLRTSYMLSLALLSYNETMQRLRVGPTLKKFKYYFEKMINNKEDSRRLYIYSGHDVNIVSLWRALGFKELMDPEYGASLTLELHQDEEQGAYYVKVFFRNNTKIDEPLELIIPHCQPCTYSKFISNINKLLPTDRNTECKN